MVPGGRLRPAGPCIERISVAPCRFSQRPPPAPSPPPSPPRLHPSTCHSSRPSPVAGGAPFLRQQSVRSLSALPFLLTPTSCAIPSSLFSASPSPQPATHPCPVRLTAAPRSCGRSRSQGRRNIAVEEELTPELDLPAKSKAPSSIDDLVHGQQGNNAGSFQDASSGRGFPMLPCPRCGASPLTWGVCENVKNAGKEFFKCCRNLFLFLF
ncbi:CREB-regulated transcription coactivator 1-like [Lolium rigidum]|uniref:CREB-regulated transcription coactivator 1-like n=1 Tax=Lolium rigidum TaxID=89674 RepID=UPI001F5C11D6|nr:CREB-regulated transcription coactivator 1-like [Lolium rigidum]